MEKDLLKIIEHFGVNNQQRKLQEEVFELQEAITKYEEFNNRIEDLAIYDIDETELKKEHIAEEIVDVMILLEQFFHHYGLDEKTLLKIEENKIIRTLERIESGYYEK